MAAGFYTERLTMFGMASMERRSVHYSGRVQGVGFRYTTTRIAANFDVRGFVRNLSDGRVELIVEGLSCELDPFLESVDAAMRDNIVDCQISVSKFDPADSLQGFEIRH